MSVLVMKCFGTLMEYDNCCLGPVEVKGYEVMLLEINCGADYCETLMTIGEENLLISSTSSMKMGENTDR